MNSWAEVVLDVEGAAKPVVQKLDRQGQNFIAKANQLPKGIKGMKLVNKSGKEQDVVLNMFKFGRPPADPGANLAALSDRNLKNGVPCGQASGRGDSQSGQPQGDQTRCGRVRGIRGTGPQG